MRDEDCLRVVEIEKKLLSALFLKDGVAIPEVVNIVDAEDFYRPQHRLIYAAIKAVYDSNVSPDVLLVESELERRGQLEKVERQSLFGLLELEYSTARAATYAQKIKEASRRREIIRACEELSEAAEEGVTPVNEIIAKAEERLFKVAKTGVAKTMISATEHAVQTYENLRARMNSKGDLGGVPTGLYDLYLLIGDLKKSDLIILAARPSMGKTALALNIATKAATMNVVALFSLEMSKEQLGQRLLSAQSEVAASRIAQGTLTNAEWESVMIAIEHWGEKKLFVDDTGGLTLSMIRNRAKLLKEEHGLDLIVIDYIQLIQGSKEYRGNRVQEVSEISRGLKALTRELDVPILALSQLSRSVELRAEKKPQLSDLRESGSIEQDADIVMFLYREEYYNRDDADVNKLAELIIAKNRNGATGSVHLQFEKEYMLFRNLTRRVD